MTTTTLAPVDTAIQVFDDVLVDPTGYRREALALPYGDVPAGDDVFRGIATFPGQMDVAQRVIDQHFPGKRVTLSFFRKSPEGQEEPNYIHSDRDHGDWTAILYLNPDPPAGDGTSFWRRRHDGAIDGEFDQAEARDQAQWERWQHVDAKFGRLLIFKSDLFHSRGLVENYGAGDEARLIQVAFLNDAPAGETVIRHATLSDVPQIVEMGLRFLRSSEYRGRMAERPEQMGHVANWLMTAENGALFVAERGGSLVGMIGLAMFTQPLSGELMAGEWFWFVNPDARGRTGLKLQKRAEQWAEDRGAVGMVMIAPNDDVARMYEAQGYSKLEVTYQRRFD